MKQEQDGLNREICMDATNLNPSSNVIVNPVPTEYNGAVPYLYIKNANAAVEFYLKAFGAKELICIRDSNNKIAHCELQIGKARIMLSDEFPEANCLSPTTLGGATSGFTLFFEDSEKIFTQALAAGAKEIRRVEKKFCGDLEGKVEDPFGHQWFIATHVENVPYDVMVERAAGAFKAH
jgi:PhnB protein